MPNSAISPVCSRARSATNYTFVDKVARKNVELTIAQIRRDSTVLSEMESQHGIKIAGSMYNLSTGAVEFFGS
jgi:carbonic anhydrase